MPLDDLHALVDVPQAVAAAQVAHGGDQVDPRIGVVDGDRHGQRLVVVPPVEDHRPRARHARPGHHVLVGEVPPHEVHVRLVGHRVLRDVVPGAQHHLEAAVGGQLRDDPLRASREVTEQHHVVGQVQGNHTSQAPAAHRLEGGGQLGEQERQRDDAADDDVDPDDPAAVETGKTSP